ncbi:hypothetical protein MHBO_000840 [Bonamia ostreae]|uniref:Uncharacterized protein n=1 Tax=Bonamia ostreae TaxID=126728 RepID=A0ABV2AH03_9EUKA
MFHVIETGVQNSPSIPDEHSEMVFFPKERPVFSTVPSKDFYALASGLAKQSKAVGKSSEVRAKTNLFKFNKNAKEFIPRDRRFASK